MNFKLALGTGVAIVAVYCVLVVGIIRKVPFYEHYHRHAGIAISVVGGVFFAVGYRKRRGSAPQAVAEADAAMEEPAEPANARPQESLLNARYVGLMSIILGVATLFILPMPHTPGMVPVRAAEPPPRPPAKSVPTNVTAPVLVPVPVKPVRFPALRLQGVILDPERPSALISGKTYYIGDRVQEAKVVAITRDHVVLELEGQQKAYLLEK